MVRNIFWSLLFWVSSGAALAQPLYTQALEENWLPKQLIRDIFQDSKGFLWIGTNAGLYKYNLHALENINLTKKTTTQFLNNTISRVREDAFGQMLVGTESGLGILDAQGNCTVISKTDESVVEIKTAPSGSVWWALANGKVYKMRPSGSGHYNAPELVADIGKNAVIYSMALLPGEELGLGTSKGFWRARPGADPVLTGNLPQSITALLLDAEQNLWAGAAGDGLFVMAKNSTAFRKVELQDAGSGFDRRIISIRPLGAEGALVATAQNVYAVERRGNDFWGRLLGRSLFPDLQHFILAAFADRTQNIWIGTQTGLYKMKKQTVRAEFFRVETNEFLPGNQITALSMRNRQLCIHNSAAGVYTMDTDSRQQSKVELPFKNARFSRHSKRGDWLFATSDKAWRYNGKSPQLLCQAGGAITDMLETSEGEWWVSTWTAGLARFFETPADSLRSNTSALFKRLAEQLKDNAHPFCLAKDHSGNIWVGTRGKGLYKVEPNTQKVRHYGSDTQAPASNRILCIKEDRKGRLWVGTRGDGLLLYEPTNDRFKVFDTKNGLWSNTICAIAESPAGHLWVSTLNGLAQLCDPALSFRSFGGESGIKSPEFCFNAAAVDEVRGDLYFGNVAGIYRVRDPEETPPIPAPLVWTQFDILNAKDATAAVWELPTPSGEANKPLNLAYNQNSFRIGFALLDYTTPEKNQYAIRLLGKDSSWQYMEGLRPQVEYVDLPPGDYVFEARSANSSGQWMPGTARLNIRIAPAFWQTRAAQALFLFLIVLLGLVGYWFWQRWFRLNRQLEEEHKIAQKQTQQIVFYTDLSHEIKNRLTLILGPLEQALHDKKVNRAVLDNLYDQALRVKKLSDQILNLRKGESGAFLLSVTEENIKSRLEKLYRDAQPLAILKNIQFSFNPQKETLRGWCDEELLEIVVQNLLNNALKYCKIGGEVSLKIDAQYLGENDLPCIGGAREGNFLICTVQDTGVGIPQAEIDKVVEPFYRAENTRLNRGDKSGTGIGLDLVARLVKLHHGCLDIRSEEGLFTAVTFYIPINKNQYSLSELKPNIVHAPVVMPEHRPEFEELEENVLILPAQTISNRTESPTPRKKSAVQILVVEDQPDIRQYVADTLSSDFSVLTAQDGAAALALLKKQEVHLIISDLSMPNMDGLTLCRCVREDRRLAHLPFIILTGRNSEEQKLVCFQNEVDDFMEKPFSPDLLRWRVKSLLRKTGTKTRIEVEPKAEIYESEDEKFIQNIVNLIDKHIDKSFLDVEFLAAQTYMSRATFYRKMEEVAGDSPSLFIRKYRLKKAAQMLRSGQFMVHEVANKTGFSDAKYFSKCFEKEFGVLPTQL